MSRRRKVLIGILVALLATAGACGIGLLALAPAEGPPMLVALPTDADVIAYAEDVETLWKTLESSDEFREFTRGPAWRALLDTGLGEALEGLRRSGLEPSRPRASHLVGREAGAAVWLAGSRLRVTSWLAAFRIDTYVCLAEVALGRLFMRGSVTRTEREGRAMAELRDGARSFHWSLLGDLLVVASSRQVLEHALEGVRARRDDTSFEGVFRSSLEAEAGSPRAGARLRRPEGIVNHLLGGGGRATTVVSTLGLPAPVDMATLSVRLDGCRLLEDTFLASPGPVSAKDGAAAIVPPPDTFFWWRFRPGTGPASDYAWGIFAKMIPPHDRGRGVSASGVDIFRGLVLPRVRPETAMALADQEVRAEGGGFPAQYTFVGVRGAALIHAGLEQLMRARGLGVYSAGDSLPVSYPYVVRRRAAGVPVYEMVVRDTRRSEGFRPAVAVRADDIVYCSSFEKLKESLEAPRGFPPPKTIFPELQSDEWLAAGASEQEVFRLEWRPPKDSRALKNAYDYVTELRRHRGPVRRLLADDTDYERFWRIASDVLGRVRRHSRVGFEHKKGMRMRAVWEFAASSGQRRGPDRADGE